MTPTELTNNIQVALEQRAEGRIELTQFLLGVSAEELAQFDGDFWERLGPEMRRRLLTGLESSETVDELAKVRRRQTTTLTSKWNYPWLVFAVSLWKALPAVPKGLSAGLMGGAAAVGIGLIFSSSPQAPTETSADGTPTCRRLTDLVATCAYRIEHSLTWRDAATRAAIPEDQLRADNPDLADRDLVRGDIIALVRRDLNTRGGN